MRRVHVYLAGSVITALAFVALLIDFTKPGAENEAVERIDDSAIQPTPTVRAGTSTPPEFPNATTTGVIPGTELTPSSGFVIDEDGTTIEGLDVAGCIEVRADNVTIRNTRVTGACYNGAIDTGDGEYHGILIEDVEVDGGGSALDAALVSKSGFTCRRCNVHGGASGFRLATDVVIEDSYVHDLVPIEGGHNTAIASNGGANYVIRNSFFENDVEGSAAFALYGDYSRIANVLVERNLFSGGGGYAVYGGSLPDKAYPEATGVRFIDNRWSREVYPRGGQYGPVAGFDPESPGNEWIGNAFLDGESIS